MKCLKLISSSLLLVTLSSCGGKLELLNKKNMATTATSYYFNTDLGECVDQDGHPGWNTGIVGECADLSGFDLSNENLDGVNLRGAQLVGTTLFEANLIGADLTCANLKDADLTSAKLQDIKRDWANFSGTLLSGTILQGADLDSGLECGQSIEENYPAEESVSPTTEGSDLLLPGPLTSAPPIEEEPLPNVKDKVAVPVTTSDLDSKDSPITKLPSDQEPLSGKSPALSKPPLESPSTEVSTKSPTKPTFLSSCDRDIIRKIQIDTILVKIERKLLKAKKRQKLLIKRVKGIKSDRRKKALSRKLRKIRKNLRKIRLYLKLNRKLQRVYERSITCKARVNDKDLKHLKRKTLRRIKKGHLRSLLY